MGKSTPRFFRQAESDFPDKSPVRFDSKERLSFQIRTTAVVSKHTSSSLKAARRRKEGRGRAATRRFGHHQVKVLRCLTHRSLSLTETARALRLMS